MTMFQVLAAAAIAIGFGLLLSRLQAPDVAIDPVFSRLPGNHAGDATGYQLAGAGVMIAGAMLAWLARRLTA